MAPPASSTTATDHLVSLLQRIARRDAQAFTRLHALTSNKLRKSVATLCSGPFDVDDVVQETYLRIWNAAATFDGNRSSPITWMCTIARNVALDAIRRKRVSLTILDEAMAVPAESQEVDEFDYSTAMRITSEVLHQLPEERRRLITLAYIEGRSRQSLAEQFGVPVGTIKTWLRRTLEGIQVECKAATRRCNPASVPT